MSMEFKTEAVFEALRGPLALVEDAEKRQAFERYVEAARYPLERAVFDLLAQLVTAVDEQVSERYRLRLSYRPGALALDVDPVQPPVGTEQAEADLPDWAAPDGETEKITIRIPAELKELATQAAGSAGISANSWFIRALARSLRAMEEPRPPRPPRAPEPPEPPHPPQGTGRPGKKLQGWYGGQ